MKKTYSKPRLNTETFTPQEAIAACWISTLNCQCQNYASSSGNVYPSTAAHNQQKLGTLSNHSPETLRVTIKTEGDAAPSVTPLSQFYSSGVFAAYASGRDPFHHQHKGTLGLAWQESGTYHFTTLNPTNWEKNQS